MIHTVKSFGVVNKAEVDVFLELSCFCNDPTDGSLYSAAAAAKSLQLPANAGDEGRTPDRGPEIPQAAG